MVKNRLKKSLFVSIAQAVVTPVPLCYLQSKPFKKITMKMNVQLFAIIGLVIGSNMVLSGQNFEIRLSPAGGSIIAVEMRETSGNVPFTSDVLTDLVFGICWDKAYSIDLDAIQSNYTIEKAGVERVSGGTEFQLFAKDANPYHFPESWKKNEWYEIMRVSNNAASSTKFGTFSLCPLSIQELNINYNLNDYGMTVAGPAEGVRIGLPDVPRVGASTSAEESLRSIRGNWTISPNPGVNRFEVTLQSDGDQDVQIVVTDVTGKMVFSDVYGAREGTNMIPLLLTGVQSGVYQVSLQWKDGFVQSKNLVISDQ